MDGMSVWELPEDSLTDICKRLDVESLLNLGLVSKAMNAVASSEGPWMNLCRERWGDVLDVTQLRGETHSAKSLYSALNRLSNLVGLWNAQELYPRGGLLYFHWGHLCLVASRVWSRTDGNVVLRPFFKVPIPFGGSFKIYFLSEESKVLVPAELIWSSKKEKFHLRLCRSIDATSSMQATNKIQEKTSTSTSDESWEAIKMLQTCDLITMVKSLGPDCQIIGFDDEIFQETVHLSREQLLFRFLDPNEHIVQAKQSNSNKSWLQGTPAFRSLQRFISMSPSSDVPKGSNAEVLLKNMDLNACVRITKSSYVKLTVAEAKSGEELAGIWRGDYGPHGLEIIHVTYTTEEIIATKLLGDPNVPCGKVTFKAILSSEQSGPDLPQEITALQDTHGFTVSKMYDGCGRIAADGYKNPTWVPGYLMVQSDGKMAFSWENVVFFIQFYRVHLES